MGGGGAALAARVKDRSEFPAGRLLPEEKKRRARPRRQPGARPRLSPKLLHPTGFEVSSGTPVRRCSRSLSPADLPSAQCLRPGLVTQKHDGGSPWTPGGEPRSGRLNQGEADQSDGMTRRWKRYRLEAIVRKILMDLEIGRLGPRRNHEEESAKEARDPQRNAREAPRQPVALSPGRELRLRDFGRRALRPPRLRRCCYQTD